MRALAGVQAQDRGAAALALRSRGAASAGAVERALTGDRSVVRTWAMRGTLHLVAADDVPLLLSVFGALYLRRGARRLAELGLPPPTAERSTAEAAAVLAAEGPLTRHELAERLRRRGVPVDPGGQAPIAVVCRAALAGVLCETGRRGREELYGPLRAGPRPDRDAALAQLAGRYAAAHHPATAADFATWSGLPADDVRRGWAAAGDPTATAAGEPAGGVILLPAFDEWLLGWAARDWTLPRQHAKAVAPGGILRPVVLVDGRVAGTWRLRRGRVEVEPFGRIPRAALDREIESVGAFLRRDRD